MTFVRISLAAVFLTLSGGTNLCPPYCPSNPAHTTTHSAAPIDTTTGAYPHEVRLRKMHLVRPDLIPYPTVQDFYA